MATNPYFSQGVESEQDLYEDMTIEALRMFGQDVYYLPRTIVSEDKILNEDIESTFSNAYKIEMYITNTDSFDGDDTLLSKFGVEIRDQANFVVSKKRWNEHIGTEESGTYNERPSEGDLIYLPLSKSLFEIKFVEHEQPFYQLSNLPTYTLQCELFEYSGEEIQTGIDEIDDAVDGLSQQFVLLVGSSNGTDFTVGEDVRQEIGDTGEYVMGRVVSFAGGKLAVTGWRTTNGEYHEFGAGPIEGTDSGAMWTVTDVYDIDDPPENDALNDDQAQNQVFESEADDILDFSESNPFGEV